MSMNLGTPLNPIVLAKQNIAPFVAAYTGVLLPEIKPGTTLTQRRHHIMSIKIKPENKGKLHEKLGVPKDKKIPAKALAKAANSKSPALRREAQFAINAKKFKH